MSEEQLKAFLEAVKADAGLQEKLKVASDADAVVAIAKEAGFVIRAEAVAARQELSDEELESVAGGTQNEFVDGIFNCFKYNTNANDPNFQNRK
jgi:predicted ribosomally synthesized peptide with nif11-like leader